MWSRKVSEEFFFSMSLFDKETSKATVPIDLHSDHSAAVKTVSYSTLDKLILHQYVGIWLLIVSTRGCIGPGKKFTTFFLP